MTFMFTEGTKGIYLFQLTTQSSMKIFDGAPVPPAKQLPEEGLVLGDEHLSLRPVPQGEVKTPRRQAPRRRDADHLRRRAYRGAIGGEGGRTISLADVDKGQVALDDRARRRHRVYVDPDHPVPGRRRLVRDVHGHEERLGGEVGLVQARTIRPAPRP